MGMSTHVIGFKPPDAKWKAMKAIYDACKEAKIQPPPEVNCYFEDCEPDDEGVSVSEDDLGDAVEEWSEDSRSGYQLLIDQLDPDIKIIRFYNAW